ncbi:MAG: hypothetical protein ABL914_13070 [Novosphingobium sp.]|uniref:arsenate reductase/protein-tyrosine-phosphatase family protein n=1 Tax=Novosphingobium sp. TaxID=1874826 RepID=UPI0032BA89E9
MIFSNSGYSRRGIIVAGGAALLAAGCTPIRRANRVTVLFVCEFGTAKSAIAREMFRGKVRNRGLAIKAFSRGLKIEDHVSPQLRSRLVAAGIDTLRDEPAILQQADWDRADLIVAFNPLPAAVPPAKIRDWTDLPSVNDDYANAMAILDRRLNALAIELSVPA